MLIFHVSRGILAGHYSDANDWATEQCERNVLNGRAHSVSYICVCVFCFFFRYTNFSTYLFVVEQQTEKNNLKTTEATRIVRVFQVRQPLFVSVHVRRKAQHTSTETHRCCGFD